MFRNTYQSGTLPVSFLVTLLLPMLIISFDLFSFYTGFLSILYSIGSKPLQIWDKKVRNGHIKRITDPDIQSSVLEIMGTNVSTTYIQCPADPKKTLGIKLPFLVMIIKNVRDKLPSSLVRAVDSFRFYGKLVLCAIPLSGNKIGHNGDNR